MKQNKNDTMCWILFSWFYRIRGLIFGVLLLVYMWFLHPWMLVFVVQARTTGRSFVMVGSGVVLVQILELPGIWLKRPTVSERIRRWPAKSFAAQFGIGVSQLTHIFLSMMVFLHVMPLFGVDGMCFDYDTQALPCLLTNLAFIAILVKEMVAFFLVLELQKPEAKQDLVSRSIQIREVLGEMLLLSFGMVTFTLSWSAIMTFIEPVTDDNWWGSLSSSLLLLMMLYPPSRLVFTFEEWLVKQTVVNRILIIVFFISTVLAALREVPGLF